MNQRFRMATLASIKASNDVHHHLSREIFGISPPLWKQRKRKQIKQKENIQKLFFRLDFHVLMGTRWNVVERRLMGKFWSHVGSGLQSVPKRRWAIHHIMSKIEMRAVLLLLCCCCCAALLLLLFWFKRIAHELVVALYADTTATTTPTLTAIETKPNTEQNLNNPPPTNEKKKEQSAEEWQKTLVKSLFLSCQKNWPKLAKRLIVKSLSRSSSAGSRAPSTFPFVQHAPSCFYDLSYKRRRGDASSFLTAECTQRQARKAGKAGKAGKVVRSHFSYLRDGGDLTPTTDERRIVKNQTTSTMTQWRLVRKYETLFSFSFYK